MKWMSEGEELGLEEETLKLEISFALFGKKEGGDIKTDSFAV